MSRPLWKRAGYQLCKNALLLSVRIYFRFRWRGREHMPVNSGALVCSNHQSYLDPVLVGVCFRGQLNYLARQSLFNSRLFGGLIRYLDSIPLDRDGMGIGGVKEALKRLKRGEMLLIFPEGTRTLDGEIGPLKPGFIALARRGRVPVLPVAVDGAFQAWPRTNRLPRPLKVRTCFGAPISVERIAQLSDDELVEEVRTRIRQCLVEAQRMRGGASS